MTTFDLLYNAIHINGMNLDYLLEKTKIDKGTFLDKWEFDRFLESERRLIKLIIKEWESKEDLR